MAELTVTIVQGKALKNVDSGKKLSGGVFKKKRLDLSDPYVKLALLGQRHQTKTVKNNVNPSFNETFTFTLEKGLSASTPPLLLEVFDSERIRSDKFIGQAKIKLGFLRGVKEDTQFHVLKDHSGGSRDGSLKVTLKYNDNGVGVDKSDTDAVAEPEAEVDPSDPAAVAAQQERDKTRAKSKSLRRSDRTLSTKPSDFQVRVKVYKARQLAGSKNLDPVCKVKVGSQQKATRKHRSTNHPDFNEILTFKFFESEVVLFDQQISLEIYNARSFRKDSLLGTFKLDVGLVYEQQEHLFARKWVMLNKPDDYNCQGYLQVTLMVVGQGDPVPVDEPEREDVDDDIEDNLLTIPGVELEPVDLIIKLFEGQDMPRADPSLKTGIDTIDRLTRQKDKEECDPYIKLGFAGRTIASKHISKTYNPTWNQELHMLINMPSLCDKLQLQLTDYDVGLFVANDDILATQAMLMSAMSSNLPDDRGFLPHFGPAYVNFYGAPREFDMFPDSFAKAMNKGVGEGSSYRGRVLLEIASGPGEGFPRKPKDDLNLLDEQKAKRFLEPRRRGYKLRVELIDLNMLSEKARGGEIEVEVSQGLFGNKFETTVVPGSSTTIGTRAVFDSQLYHYVAWEKKKPCLELSTTWEDSDYRMEALNSLLNTAASLDAAVEALSGLAAHHTPTQRHCREVFVLTLRCLSEYIRGCERPLPEFNEIFTKLDQNLLDLRETEKLDARDEAVRVRQRITANGPERIAEEVDSIGDLRDRIQAIAKEPQLEIPDVIFWLLSNSKRVAYYRIPAYQIMYSRSPHGTGRRFGKVVTDFMSFPKVTAKNEKKARDIPAQLQFRAWFGPADTEDDWPELNAAYIVLAESYHNQRWTPVKKYSDFRLPTDRPNWSDRSGKREQKLQDATPPEGWQWASEWYADPEVLDFDPEASVDSVVEEVYENQRFVPLKGWGGTLRYPGFSNEDGSEKRIKEDVLLPPGWIWEGEWKIDHQRSGDRDGWVYSFDWNRRFREKRRKTDFVRRRCIIRTRVRDPAYLDPAGQATDDAASQAGLDGEEDALLPLVTADEADAGWEYALDYKKRFHPERKKSDTVRRRRHHRELVPASGDTIELTPDEECLARAFSVGTYMKYHESTTWQLRAHIYQSRDLIAEDESGFADPYLQVLFGHSSARTRIIRQTICAKWDEVVVLDSIQLAGTREQALEILPRIVCEVYDHDQIGGNDFLGRFTASPTIRTKHSPSPAPLAWFDLVRSQEAHGQILASFELIPAEECPTFPLPPKKRVVEEYTRKRHAYRRLPEDIRPETERARIDVLAWGLRDLLKYHLQNVDTPSIQFECDGVVSETEKLSLKGCPNFTDRIRVLEVDLPKKDIYTPPLNIRVYDNRKFGRKPLVGIHSVSYLRPYKYKPQRRRAQSSIDFSADPAVGAPDALLIDMGGAESNGVELVLPPPSSGWVGPELDGDGAKGGKADDGRSVASAGAKSKTGSILDATPGLPDVTADELRNDTEADGEFVDDTVDWWTKYFASQGVNQKKAYEGDRIAVFHQELEKQFDLEDVVRTFQLVRGRDPRQENSGVFKGSLAVFNLAGPPSEPIPEPGAIWQALPPSGAQTVTVRVYVIRGMDLQAKDNNGRSDPYVQIHLGKKRIVKDKKNYVPLTLNPTFGRMYEFTAELPKETQVRISLWDYDSISADDLIGETVIDLETRFLSASRAHRGLAQSYTKTGPNAWRDCETPTQILASYCDRFHLDPPTYGEREREGIRVSWVNVALPERHCYEQVPIAGGDAELAKENVALKALQAAQMVPEHVEARALYSRVAEGIEQGKVEMWMDIFPEGAELPPPVEINPRRPEKYVLRIVVWNTEDVVLDEKNFAGERMSDIYVKSFVRGLESGKQKTDVHYRSLNGEGNFNWRHVHDFEYLPTEELIVVRKKRHFFNRNKEEIKVEPVLAVQIWDNDLFSFDDYLGSVDIDLTNIITPSKRSRDCRLDRSKPPPRSFSLFRNTVSPEDNTPLNLFKAKQVRGWFPCQRGAGEDLAQTGKVELELELLTEDEAKERPAGKGRKDPNQFPTLPKPNRPATSFLWILSPWKTFRYILWKNYKWRIIGLFILTLLVLILGIFLYHTPFFVIKSAFGDIGNDK